MNVSKNIRNLANFFVMLFLILSGGLVYWQVGVAQAVTSNVHNSRFCAPDSFPVRGNIFDRNGVLLAYSVSDPNGRCGYRRVYTNATLAGLIGYYVPGYSLIGIEKEYNDILSGRHGLTVLDNTFNSLLHRPPIGNDIYLTIDDRIQRIADQHFDDPTSGTSQSNRGSIIVSDPHTGEILAMVSRPNFDPNKMVQALQQGDVSYYNQLVPDPNDDDSVMPDLQYGTEPNMGLDPDPMLVRPLHGRYVPGSVYKTTTLLAGLDSGHTTLDEKFYDDHNPNHKQARIVVINGQQIGPVGNNIDGYTYRFPVTTEYGFAHSDNVIFAQIGIDTGLDTWMDYNKRFYVGQKIPFDLDVAVSRVLPAGQDTMNVNVLAANAFGQGTDFVTPFQMSLFNNAIASDGKLMRPRLFLKITDHQTITDPQKQYQSNAIIQAFDQQTLGTPISQQTATETRQAMYGVIRCGSGLLVPELFGSQTSIIGKTGTAEVGNGHPPHGWMITAAPYTVANPDQLPALTIVAMKENDGHGADAVGPMIAHIYEDVFSKGYVQAQLPPIPGREYCTNTGLLQS